jgi:hypothetical protein
MSLETKELIIGAAFYFCFFEAVNYRKKPEIAIVALAFGMVFGWLRISVLM